MDNLEKKHEKIINISSRFLNKYPHFCFWKLFSHAGRKVQTTKNYILYLKKKDVKNENIKSCHKKQNFTLFIITRKNVFN